MVKKCTGRCRILWERSNWLRSGDLTGWGLRYGQEFASGEFEACGWEKMTSLPMWQHFLVEEFSRGQVSWAISNSETRNLASGETQLEALYLLNFSSFLSYQSLPQITLSWVENLD